MSKMIVPYTWPFLTHVVGLNLPAAPEAARHLAAALGDGADPFGALLGLYARLGPPSSLGELGLAERELDRATDLVMPQVPDSNPRQVARHEMRELLGRAGRGDTPVPVPLTTLDTKEHTDD
jgi:maleylacetate reductase